MEIVAYKSATDMDILFEDGFIFKGASYKEFKSGKIKNPYIPSLYNVGFMGDGQYDSSNKAYNVWRGMIERCYSQKRNRSRDKSYHACSVSDEWKNYQNFAKWYNENYYEIEDQIMMLDKDILFRGNQIYSKDYCMIVPHSINMTLVGRERSDQGVFPLGVSYNKSAKKYQSDCSYLGKRKYLGIYDTIEEASEAYKNFKKSSIVSLAEKYKESIPVKLYQALINYEI